MERRARRIGTLCRFAQKYQKKKPERFLTEEEFLSLGQVLNENEAEGPENLSAVKAIRLLMLAGCRLNEIAILRWEGVHLETAGLRFRRRRPRRAHGFSLPCRGQRAVASFPLFSTWALSKEYGLTDVDGGRPDWGTFFPRKVQEIVDGDEPTEGNIFIVRTRLYQAELDPAADDEAGRLRTWLARHD